MPTIHGTDEVAAGSGGLIWFTAGDEIGTITTAGKVGWPSCYSDGCEYPPVAMTTGPEGSFWVASGEGHCPGYCGGGSEQLYIFGTSRIRPYALPSVKFGVGPYLAPIRHAHTSVVVGCGRASACRGTLRLRALVRPPSRHFSAKLLSKVSYALAPGEIRRIALRLPRKRWEHLPYSRGFAIVDALQRGKRVAKRGFYFTAKKGGTAKHW